jgi:hypothetical protein
MENLFTEIEQPPESLYKQVGYNDLPRIMKMMDGNDVEKRAALLRSAQTSNMSRKEEVMEEHALKDLQRRSEKTKMHYRRYYQEELERCPSFK